MLKARVRYERLVFMDRWVSCRCGKVHAFHKREEGKKSGDTREEVGVAATNRGPREEEGPSDSNL